MWWFSFFHIHVIHTYSCNCFAFNWCCFFGGDSGGCDFFSVVWFNQRKLLGQNGKKKRQKQPTLTNHFEQIQRWDRKQKRANRFAYTYTKHDVSPLFSCCIIFLFFKLQTYQASHRLNYTILHASCVCVCVVFIWAHDPPRHSLVREDEEEKASIGVKWNKFTFNRVVY